MKILIIGTTAYQMKMRVHALALADKGHICKLPAFDFFSGTEIQMCTHNKELILWADEVHVLWDGRSTGTIFDLGMCFALNKKIKTIYLEKKNFVNLLKQMVDNNAEDK